MQIQKQSGLSKFGDVLMLPLMYVLQLSFIEVPQRTHYWNNVKFPITSIAHLDSHFFVSVPADQSAVQRWLFLLPIFHMPIIGGWKKYVVLEPVVPQDVWYVGWIPGDTAGLSQIALTGSVRLLRGQTHVYFFGVNEHGEQIRLREVGEGIVGKSGVFAKVPLL